MLYLLLIVVLLTAVILGLLLLIVKFYYWGPAGRPPQYRYQSDALKRKPDAAPDRDDQGS